MSRRYVATGDTYPYREQFISWHGTGMPSEGPGLKIMAQNERSIQWAKGLPAENI